MSDMTLFLFALAFGLTALYLHLSDLEAPRKEARRRNPKTWED